MCQKFHYYLHLFLQRHYELLVKDARCISLKAELQSKAIYHGIKAYSTFNYILPAISK